MFILIPLTIELIYTVSVSAMNLYGGLDPRNLPNYTASDAARHLRIPPATVRAWAKGTSYRAIEGRKTFSPVITASQPKPLRLSFINLIELHILRAIRTQHKIDLNKIRDALDYLETQLNISHPLAHTQFRTDGVDLFIEHYGELINASSPAQGILKGAIEQHLERIEPDDRGLAIRLYPFTRDRESESPRILAIDPRIAFGRLAIVGRGIPVDIITSRYRAGDSIHCLAEDYRCPVESIEEAIRSDLVVAA
ncbi:MAG: DUF433 domain-containing protein [Desertifilum sp.]|nr:DUF433 domain-containing protein [Desertifilum sp.]